MEHNWIEALWDKFILLNDKLFCIENKATNDLEKEFSYVSNLLDRMTDEVPSKDYISLRRTLKLLSIVSSLIGSGEENFYGITGTLFSLGISKVEEAFIALDQNAPPEEFTEIISETIDSLKSFDENKDICTDNEISFKADSYSMSGETWGPWEPPYSSKMCGEFLHSLGEHIHFLEDGIILLTQNPNDKDELINALFRCSHNIKGECGMFLLRPIEMIADRLEDVFEKLRKGTLNVNISSAGKILDVVDLLKNLHQEITETKYLTVALDSVLNTINGLSDKHISTDVPMKIEIDSKQKQIEKQYSTELGTSPKREYLRIDFEKLDRMVGLMGDLFSKSFQLDNQLKISHDISKSLKKIQGILYDKASENIEEDYQELERSISEAIVNAENLTGVIDEFYTDLKKDYVAFQDNILEMRLVPVESVLGKMKRVVHDALTKENKKHEKTHKMATVVIKGGHTELDKVIADKLENILIHIIRNAVAHGIEPIEERRALSKSTEGKIVIAAEQRGGRFLIEVNDDGRGIDLKKLIEKAVENKMVTKNEIDKLTDDERLNLIFMPGLTTSNDSDSLSGRGVGLDEVTSKLNSIKGVVEVKSELGKGTSFRIWLPLTLAMMQVLIVNISGEEIAIPVTAVKKVFKRDEVVIQKKENKNIVKFDNESIPLISLAALLDLEIYEEEKRVVIISAGQKQIAVMIGDIIGKKEAVIKSLGTFLPRAPFISGAIIVMSRCIFIVSPHEILSNTESVRISDIDKTAIKREQMKSKEYTQTYTALVAEDDSLFRKYVREALNEAGYKVIEAIDGSSALNLALDNEVHFVVTDLIMPGIDGYELTKRLRSAEKYRSIPIIMVSQKSDEVDKSRGFAAGVDKYLSKPLDKERLLSIIKELLQ